MDVIEQTQEKMEIYCTYLAKNMFCWSEHLHLQYFESQKKKSSERKKKLHQWYKWPILNLQYMIGCICYIHEINQWNGCIFRTSKFRSCPVIIKVYGKYWEPFLNKSSLKLVEFYSEVITDRVFSVFHCIYCEVTLKNQFARSSLKEGKWHKKTYISPIFDGISAPNQS